MTMNASVQMVMPVNQMNRANYQHLAENIHHQQQNVNYQNIINDRIKILSECHSSATAGCAQPSASLSGSSRSFASSNTGAS